MSMREVRRPISTNLIAGVGAGAPGTLEAVRACAMALTTNHVSTSLAVDTAESVAPSHSSVARPQPGSVLHWIGTQTEYAISQ